MAKILAVSISENRGTIKEPQDSVVLVENYGIEGDAHAGDWHRQVSLLDQSSVDKMIEQGATGLTPGIFAENLTTEGISLSTLPLGTRLKIGDALLEVTQIGKICHQHCQIYQQVGMCIMPLEGVFTKVLKGGTIQKGDEIQVIPVIRVAVVTISDKGFAGTRQDKSGPALVQALTNAASVVQQDIVPDEKEQIAELLAQIGDSGKVDIIFTTGGTGVAPRDVTPEATLSVIDRVVPGISEAMRAASLQITPRAMLSRATAGIRKGTLIINLPGSPKAALECLEVFLPVMQHAVETLRGETYECGRK